MIQEQLIKKERFTSIQSAQAGLTGVLKTAEKGGFFYRVLRNNQPIGTLLPNNVWEGILEDLEAINSPTYLQSIREARKSPKLYTSDEVKRELRVN